jgi:uncharacterized damage-inducible protein DinB
VDRETLLNLWDESWAEGIWFASWSEAMQGITADQAAWKPEGGKHSIWQLVGHVNFWRGYTLDAIAGKPKPAPEDVKRRNFPEPGEASEAAWQRARAELEATHRRVHEAIANEATPLERLKYHLAHDSYHLGQIMYLRSMLGYPPVG